MAELILAKRLIQGESIFEVNVPKAARGLITLCADIDLTDLKDPSKSLAVMVETFDGLNWKFFAGFTYTGGDYLNPETGVRDQPGLKFDVSMLPSRTVRIKINAPVALTAGAKAVY